MKDFEKEFDEKCEHKFKLRRTKYNGHCLSCSECTATWSDKIRIIEQLFSSLEQRDIKIKELLKKERERITEIVNNMPDCFPERESDEYERAYRDAKSYIINKLKQ